MHVPGKAVGRRRLSMSSVNSPAALIAGWLPVLSGLAPISATHICERNLADRQELTSEWIF